MTADGERPPARGGLELAAFLPYRIVALGHLMGDALARAYENEGVSVAEWRVLAVIAQVDGAAARDVVAKTPMDKMAVSRALTSLERRGFVDRRACERDKRVARLTLTQTGAALFGRISDIALRFQDGVLEGVGDEDRRRFDGVLRRLETRTAAQLD